MRLRIVLMVVLALVATGCAGPEVSNGDDVSGGNDRVVDDESPQDASSSAPDGPVASAEPDVSIDEPDTNPTVLEEEAPEQDDGTTPALVTSTTLQKSTPSSSTTTPAETVPPAVADGDFAGKAKADLAKRLGIAAESIEVVSFQEVDWPDSSIGCPQPDMVYSQVITNGSKLILSYNGVSYSYHSAAMGDPFYCENPVDPVPGSET